MENITDAGENEYTGLLTIWEDSVRVTHHFLSEEDIQSLKPQVLQHYFPAVKLKVWRNPEGKPDGFLGVAENKIEMLFISPESRGKGIGKKLLLYAIEQMKADSLDVNEQNPQAVGFYLHMGFEITGRSETDGQGNPFPLLHMKLK